jgi:hypothetical protein
MDWHYFYMVASPGPGGVRGGVTRAFDEDQIVKMGVTRSAKRRLAEHRRAGLTGWSWYGAMKSTDAAALERMWRGYVDLSSARVPAAVLPNGWTEAVECWPVDATGTVFHLHTIAGNLTDRFWSEWNEREAERVKNRRPSFEEDEFLPHFLDDYSLEAVL